MSSVSHLRFVHRQLPTCLCVLHQIGTYNVSDHFPSFKTVYDVVSPWNFCNAAHFVGLRVPVYDLVSSTYSRDLFRLSLSFFHLISNGPLRSLPFSTLPLNLFLFLLHCRSRDLPPSQRYPRGLESLWKKGALSTVECGGTSGGTDSGQTVLGVVPESVLPRRRDVSWSSVPVWPTVHSAPVRTKESLSPYHPVPSVGTDGRYFRGPGRTDLNGS